MVENGITLIVNGRTETGRDPEESLLNFLREELGLVGAKDGCHRGQCGACTVVVDGKAVKACTRKLKSLQGAQIQTVEGLCVNGELHPLQQAFLKLSAFQCGFCTPGMLMAAKALLDGNPSPTEAEIQTGLKANICRCTGYKKIVEAVQLAAAVLRGETTIDLCGGEGRMGARAVRTDGLAKVTGAAVYTDDYKLVRPLQGKMKFSDYPHAKILAVDVAEAEKMPGVVKIARHADIPGRKIFGQGMVPQQPVITGDVARFVGDPVAVVYAETEAEAYDAIEKIKVEYEELPVITTPEQAMADGAYQIFEEGNLLKHHHTHKGDIERGFALSDVIVESDFETSCIDHGYMEPDAAQARYDDSGRLVVYGSVQNPMGLVKDLCACLDLQEDQIVVVTRPCGGAFGGREEPSLHIQAALGTLLTGRPVRMVFTREELNLFSTKRHAMKLHYKLGATRDGMLQAAKVAITGDTGAYMSSGEYVLFRSLVYSCGPYEIPNAWVDTYAVYTNNVPAASMRGFGSPQPCAAVETLLDELAEQCGLTPFEIRQKNGLSLGKQTLTGHVVDYACGFQDCLSAVKAAVEKDALPSPSAPGKKVGVGVAGSMKNVGLGSGMEDAAWAQMRLEPDGTLLLMAGGVECGQGHDTVVVQLASEALGLPMERIRISPMDSSYSLDGGITTASRLTFVSGNACKTVAALFKNTLLAFAAKRAGLPESRLALDENGVHSIGGGPRWSAGFAELAKIAYETNDIPYEKYYYIAPATRPLKDCSDNPSNDLLEHRMHFSYGYGFQAAVVEVDEATGAVQVLRVYAAGDVGRAVNPALVEGQIEGGVAMGLGYALTEEFVQEDARPTALQFRQLGLPNITQVPTDIRSFIIEDFHPYGPYGAKGMGELPTNATAPAILNAIHDAVGVRPQKLPVRPADLLELMEKR